MVLEPMGVCFRVKLWVMKSRSCFHPSPRLHTVGDVLWNSEPDSLRQFLQRFKSALLVFKTMRFWPKSCKTTHPKHLPEGSTFWWDGRVYAAQIHIHLSSRFLAKLSWWHRDWQNLALTNRASLDSSRSKNKVPPVFRAPQTVDGRVINEPNLRWIFKLHLRLPSESSSYISVIIIIEALSGWRCK